MARLLNTRSISCAYGRFCRMRSCARRSFDDETIFMAFVICCVDFVARTRRRMSISDGMVGYQVPFRSDQARAAAAPANCSPNSFSAAFNWPLISSSSVFFSRIVVSRVLNRVVMKRSSSSSAFRTSATAMPSK